MSRETEHVSDKSVRRDATVLHPLHLLAKVLTVDLEGVYPLLGDERGENVRVFFQGGRCVGAMRFERREVVKDPNYPQSPAFIVLAFNQVFEVWHLRGTLLDSFDGYKSSHGAFAMRFGRVTVGFNYSTEMSAEHLKLLLQSSHQQQVVAYPSISRSSIANSISNARNKKSTQSRKDRRQNGEIYAQQISAQARLHINLAKSNREKTARDNAESKSVHRGGVVCGRAAAGNDTDVHANPRVALETSVTQPSPDLLSGPMGLA